VGTFCVEGVFAVGGGDCEGRGFGCALDPADDAGGALGGFDGDGEEVHSVFGHDGRRW